MKIAVAQIQVLAGRLQENFLTIQKNISAAKKQKAHLIVFPEMALTGYFIGDAWERSSFLRECEHYHSEIAKLADGIDIIFGSIGIDWHKKNEDGRVRKYNALFYASHSQFVQNSKTNYYFWPKTLLPNYREFDDSRHFYDLRKLAFERNCSLSDLYLPLCCQLSGEDVFIGPSICEDAWGDDYGFSPIEIFAATHFHDFFVNLSCSPFTKEKGRKRDEVFSKLAQKIKTPVVYVNCTGIQNVGKTVYGFDGSSAYYEPAKKTVSVGGFFTDSLGCVVISQKHVSDEATQARVDAMAALGHEETESQRQRSMGQVFEKLPGIEKTRISLEYILKNCVKEWNIKNVVIGVSGGIDSALSAVLFSRVIAKENLYLVNMPSQFNSLLTQNAAKKLAQNLNCHYASVSIEDSIEYTKNQMAGVFFQIGAEAPRKLNPPAEIIFENIQARDRGARILSALAASLQAVFPCNANKTELTVGYSTLYGDMAGFLCPIADLWKHDVYALANHYNKEIFKKEIIPKETLEVIPSAELSADQDVMKNKGDPFFYPYHDFLFRSWIEHWDRKTPADCVEAYLQNTLDDLIGCKKGLSKKLFPSVEQFKADLDRWWKLYRGMGAFKRMQAAPLIAVTKRAFGYDHRESV